LRRYERASLIVTATKPFSARGEIFGDEVPAAAMIDRLVHHAEILALKGDSYRLKDRDLARTTAMGAVAGLRTHPGPQRGHDTSRRPSNRAARRRRRASTRSCARYGSPNRAR